MIKTEDRKKYEYSPIISYVLLRCVSVSFYHFCNRKFIGNLGREHLNATVPLYPTKRLSHVIKILCNTGVIIEAYLSCVSRVATLQL